CDTRLPDTEHRTPSTAHRPPNPEHRTPNTEHRTPNSEHRPPNTPLHPRPTSAPPDCPERLPCPHCPLCRPTHTTSPGAADEGVPYVRRNGSRGGWRSFRAGAGCLDGAAHGSGPGWGH